MLNYALRKEVAVLSIANAPVNSLNTVVRRNLLKYLDQAISDKARSVVLIGEGNIFSAGADIKEFARGSFMEKPHLNDVVDYLDDYKIPLVACIHGNAIGGGFESALACHWRIGTTSAILGLPEVKIGLLPGAGGTQRLARLVGLSKAYEIISSGRFIDYKEALSLGLLDQLMGRTLDDHESIIDEAVAYALSDKVLETPIEERRVSSKAIPFNNNEEILSQIEKKVESDSKGYLAPKAIYTSLKAAATSSNFIEGINVEREEFLKLMKGPQSKALQYFFFAERQCNDLEKIIRDHSSTINEYNNTEIVPKTINTIGIIGGGTMGTGIALNCINSGLRTILIEKSAEILNKARHTIETQIASSKTNKRKNIDLSRLSSLVQYDTELELLSEADLIIEAINENIIAKKNIFERISHICHSDAILATNTSTLSIAKIASATGRQQDVIGMHFFSPANIMKLVEVIQTPETSLENIVTVMKLTKKLQKSAVLVNDCWGFVGNRMLEPYFQEGLLLLEEGASVLQIDNVLKNQIGIAMGLFEMSDLAGNDVWYYIQQEKHLMHSMAIQQHTEAEEVRRSDLMEVLFEKGLFGQKSGGGWYDYNPAAPRKAIPSTTIESIISEHRAKKGIIPREITDKEIKERCLYPLINEGLRILEEGVASKSSDIDVVYVYGYGFPKYRGGPMWWAEREIGFTKVFEALNTHYKTFPNQPWLQPCKLLEEVASSGASLREELHFRKGELEKARKKG